MMSSSVIHSMTSVNGSPLDEDIDLIDVSDHWLRVFAAVSVEGSFTSAARTLRVGQPAVSHAIKQLESRLGTPLFDRIGGGVRLTEVGRDLDAHVRPAFAALDTGVRAVRRQVAEPDVVALSVSTSFASWWLLPHLGAFKQDHPGIEIRCITSDADLTVGLDDAHLWIPLGAGPWPGLETHPLCDEHIVAVVSAELADSLDDPDDPAALASIPLVHLEERYRPRYDWARWFADHGLGAPPRSGPRSNDYVVVIQAALDGQGAALGWRHIVDPLIESGRLVPVGGAGVSTSATFDVVHRPGALRPDVAALRDWLISSVGVTRDD